MHLGDSGKRPHPRTAPGGDIYDLIHDLDVIVWEMDAERRRFTFVSRGAEDLLGYPLDQWLAEPDFWAGRLVHPDDRAWTGEFCRSAVEEGRDHRFEYRAVAADGRVLWLRDLVRVVQDEEGRNQLRGVMIDITEQKRAEEALRESEERFRSMIENVSDIVAVVDAGHTFHYVSPSVERILDYTADEVLGRSPLDFVHPDDAGFLEQRMASRLRGERDPDRMTEVRFRHRDGSWRILQVRSRRHEQGPGEPTIVLAARDVTEERRTKDQRDRLLAREEEIEAALDRREQELRVLVERSPDVITHFDSDLRHTYVSLAIERAGLSPEAFLGRTHAEFAAEYGIPEPFAARWTEVLTRVRDSKGEEIIRFDFPHPNGIQYWECRVAPVLGPGGAVEGLIAVGRDVTAQTKAEAALRESEAHLRSLLKDVRAIIWECDADTWAFTYISQGVEEILGYPVEQWYEDASLWANTIHPEDRAWVIEACMAGMKACRDSTLEYRSIARDGRVVWLRDIIRIITGDDGRPERLRGVMIDITEHKLAEEEILRHERRLEAAQRIANIGDWEWDLATDTVTWSDALFRISDLEPQGRAITFERYLELIHPADRGSVRATIEKCLATREPFSLEHRVVWPDGTVRYVHSRGEVVVGPDGVPIRMFGTRHDITERRQAEEALSASEARFRALVENISDAIAILEADATVRYVSPTFERLTGYAAEERAGRYAFERVHPEDLEMVRREWQELLGMPGGRVSFEPRMQRKDGQWRTVELVGKNLLNDPVIRGIVVTYQDVTDRRILEEQLRQAQKMEAVGRLAGGIAHDFNNVLTAIGGYTQFMLGKLAEGDPLREDALVIQKSAARAAQLTRQLLAFGRRQVLQPRVIDPAELIREMQKMLARLIGEDIELVVEPSAGGCRIKADPGQIEQVLMNLALNGRDAMPAGGRLTIAVRSVELDAGFAGKFAYHVETGRYVLLEVSDTGTGMDAETLARVFEPFFTTKERGKGTGLGLATVYGIVKQSGGYIWAESAPGRGTTFRIYFPRVDEAAQAESHVEPRTSLARGSETILLVEDDEEVRAFIRRSLVSRNYAVLEAPSAGEALVLAMGHKGPIHLLLTDMIMPQMSGLSLGERLAPLRPEMRVLLMSGYADDMALRHGIVDSNLNFLEKPFTEDMLNRRIRKILDPPAGQSARQGRHSFQGVERDDPSDPDRR